MSSGWVWRRCATRSPMLQGEIQLLRRQLEETARREAELEAALAESGPQRRTAGAGFRPWARQLRRNIEGLGVRALPTGILPFVWHNPLFDARWYLGRYPDVRSSKTAPERHYRRHGMAEGRDPNAFFDTSWYLSHYPDVAARGMDPLDHYHLFGAWEGRDPGPLFRTRWYLALNPDVRDAGVDPLLHYLRHGALEGRPPRPARRPGSQASSRSSRLHPARPCHCCHKAGPNRVCDPLDGVPLDRPVVLILDDKFPRPDRDAGSVLTLHYVRLFQDLGYHVHFVATQDDSEGARYRKSLAASGATVLDASTDSAAVLGLLEAAGPRFAAVLLSGISVAGRYLDEIQGQCRDARTIFLTHDLHFLREERAAMLAGDRVGMYRAAGTRELEIHVARTADATIVVSSVEQDILEAAAPGARVFWCPLIQDVVGRVNGFAKRSGVAFVGGYRHGPNVDAVRWFLADVWPSVRRALPMADFFAIGADMPSELRRRDDDGFVAVGHVKDLTPWLERVRITVAPLRYGAGAKGKVVSSLARGVPCVATPIGAEGMEASGRGIVSADDAEAFATAVVRLHNDEAEWERQSDAGLQWVEATTSLRMAHERLTDLLLDISAPVPVDTTAASPGGQPMQATPAP